MLLKVSVVEQRYDAVKEVLAAGLSVAEVARRCGMAQQSVHRWMRYRKGGVGAFSGIVSTPHLPALDARRNRGPA